MRVLTTFAALLLNAFIFATPAASQDIGTFYDQVDTFMSQHVDGHGQIDYAGIKQAPTALSALVTSIAQINPSSLDDADHKAFIINAYNVLVIQNVIDHFPTDSPLSVDGFFDAKTFKVGNNSFSLNGLEKEYLYQKFPDARLHFALVCAAKGKHGGTFAMPHLSTAGSVRHPNFSEMRCMSATLVPFS